MCQRASLLENAKLSLLALPLEKDFPSIFLNVQYLMAPAIAQWLSQHFYGGKLLNAPSVALKRKSTYNSPRLCQVLRYQR